MIAKSNDDTFMNVNTLGGALHRSLKENAVDGDVPLKEHPGKGFTTLQMGMDSLMRRARTMELRPSVAEAAKAAVYDEYHKGEALCESPIERSMLAALLTAQWTGFETIPPKVHAALDKSEMLPNADVVIVPQLAFLRYRLDFGMVFRVSGLPPQIIAVECDGAEFHTEYERETQRVNYLKSWGIPVFKFTGSEIYSDVFAAAGKVAFGVSQWRAGL